MIGGGPERRNLDNFPTEANMCQTETPADQATIAEQRPHLLRCRVGRDVEVLGVQLQYGIPNATADQECLIA